MKKEIVKEKPQQPVLTIEEAARNTYNSLFLARHPETPPMILMWDPVQNHYRWASVFPSKLILDSDANSNLEFIIESALERGFRVYLYSSFIEMMSEASHDENFTIKHTERK